MSKEKLYIVISHKHSLKKNTKDQWEVTEQIEFVNQLRNRHYTTSSAIGDYINRKMLRGERIGMAQYNTFEEYIRKKYTKQMAEFDAAYGSLQIVEASSHATFSDQFGNVREPTIFDSV